MIENFPRCIKISATKLNMITFAIALSGTACSKSVSQWSDLPPEMSIDSFPKTEFVATLENPIAKLKNSIYAPALLFCWDKVESKLNSQVISSNQNSVDFNLLNSSKSYQKSLFEAEYTADVKLEDGTILAHAFFNKTLPFAIKFEDMPKGLNFSGKKVDAFGMNYYDADLAKMAEVKFYKNDDNFILKLSPKDEKHEIILVKGLPEPKTLSEALKTATDLIAVGAAERKTERNAWKYEINDIDRFAVPKIKFNIVSGFPKLSGQHFKTRNGEDYFIDEITQRTALVLNESGAVVESEATVSTDSVETPAVKIFPKNLFLDKPFLIIIKRTNQPNPYFVMFVRNTELLK